MEATKLRVVGVQVGIVLHGESGQLGVGREVARRANTVKELERDLEMARAGMQELDVRWASQSVSRMLLN